MMRGRGLVNRLATLIAAMAALVPMASPAVAEDGYALWLRHAPLEGEVREKLAALDGTVYAETAQSPTVALAVAELNRGLDGLLGRPVAERIAINYIRVPGSGPKGSFFYDCRNSDIQREGAFRVEGSDSAVRITAAAPIGCLYATYALLRELGQGRAPADIRLDEAPAMPLRMLNHWDNPDGYVERGYAGRSIFDWWHLPERLDPRLIDYARANASLGINGVVVNNVNAKAYMLEPRYIGKLKRLADALRPYGIRVFMSARFSAPREIGRLATADPLDPQVAAWWKAKADEIYATIPDFGGFLVKANSEGQPGPQDYGRSHADGANMLATALGARGTVIWRAFVYRAENSTDRTMQAYAEFQPLDGQFAPNVVLQIKNGPLDFQPREPFHPLFGAMPKTRLMLEAQITREYLGQGTGMAYLAPLWKEVLDANTGRGGTVAQIVAPVGMAGVANVGSDRNWTGTHFDQANWYAFGRLAWNPALTSEEIAREWIAQTFTRNPVAIRPIAAMMLGSRDLVAQYIAPLGLAHLMGTGHHYGPAPWVCDLERPDWNPCYYHRADKQGIGFDRTASGSGALGQYAPGVAAQWTDPDRIDEKYLLWFHHVPWDRRIKGGDTLWQRLTAEYSWAEISLQSRLLNWEALREHIDPERHAAVAADMARELKDARWWRDASMAYWQSVNGLPLPAGARPIPESLEAYKARRFPEAPGQ